MAVLFITFALFVALDIASINYRAVGIVDFDVILLDSDRKKLSTENFNSDGFGFVGA